MVLTDTHTHIYYEENAVELENKMNRCFTEKVNRLFLPNVDLSSLTKIKQLVQNYPSNCFAMNGLHPCDVKEDYLEVLNQLKSIELGVPIYAIGEIGIDLYWDKSTLAFQQHAFKFQIDWAIELDLPIVIHCREAFDEVFEVLEEKKQPKLRGIFHCFTGTIEQAQKAIDLGFYLGIGGVVTYKKANLDLVLETVDLKHIVLETDSPYLAPVPRRGKPNESSYLIHIANKVAEIYNLPVEEIAKITTENSIKIFKI